MAAAKLKKPIVGSKLDVGPFGTFTIPPEVIAKRRTMYTLTEVAEMLSEAGVEVAPTTIGRLERGVSPRMDFRAVLAYFRLFDYDLEVVSGWDKTYTAALVQKTPGGDFLANLKALSNNEVVAMLEKERLRYGVKIRKIRAAVRKRNEESLRKIRREGSTPTPKQLRK